MHHDVNETLRVAKPVFPFGAAAGPQTLEFVPKSSSWLPDQINHPDFRESQAITSDSSSNSQKREDNCMRDADTLQLGK